MQEDKAEKPLEEIEDLLISEEEISSMSKTQLADKLDELLRSEEIQPHLAVVREIKSRFDELVKEEYQAKLRTFMQDGSPEEDFSPRPDPQDKQIEQQLKSFNRKKADQHNQKEKLALENLSTKKLILEELKELLKGKDSFSKSYNKFQALQSKWRATGNVPQSDIRTLTENYHFLTGKFYDIMKISNELRDLDRKKNLELKTELCEKAEKLAAEPSIKKSVEGLQFLQETWRETGLLTREVHEPLAQRFKAAADKIVERKKEHIAALRQQQTKNLAAKTDLCLQLEMITNTGINSYKLCKEASEKTEAIWAEWQKIGFVPKNDNGACWVRFKKARKQVYDIIDAFYAEQRKEFGNNLLKKTELCIKAEALQESTDWASTAEMLKRLQREWKTLGQVARKDSEPIWNRFRKACDYFFEKKIAGDAVLENAAREQEKVNKSRSALRDKIKVLQAEVNQLENNLSFFGKSKKTNPILEEYQLKLDKSKIELKELNDQLKAIPT